MTPLRDLSDPHAYMAQFVADSDSLIRLEDDGTSINRLNRGVYRADDKQGLDQAIRALTGTKLVRIGLAEHQLGDDGFATAACARCVWIETERADVDLDTASERHPDASLIVGTYTGEPMCVGWLLDDPLVTANRYEVLSNALAERTDGDYDATSFDGYVLLPGTVSPTTPAGMVGLTGTLRRYPAERLELLLGLDHPESAVDQHSAPTAADVIDRPAQDREAPPIVHARVHDVDRLAADPDILARLREGLHASGFAGATEVAELVFLAVVSRLLTRPLCVVIRAASSAGKSFAVEAALRFAAPSGYYALQAMTPKALAYTPESLRNRILVIAEAAGISSGFMTYALRELISSGRLRHEYTDFDRGTTKVVETEGPTGLILTTTGPIDPELATRMLTVDVPESAEQTGLILKAIAAEAAGAQQSAVDYELFHLLHDRLAEGSRKVLVPYAPALVELIDHSAVRMRRDFSATVTVIKAHALLHQETREHDESGRIVATLDDYDAAHRLVAHAVAEGTARSISSQLRETVAAVERLSPPGAGPVTINGLIEHLGIDGSTARRRVIGAVRSGYLHDSGGGPGRPHRLTIGEPLPDDRSVLPGPNELRAVVQSCVHDEHPET
jgi:YD repeat-containing protein